MYHASGAFGSGEGRGAAEAAQEKALWLLRTEGGSWRGENRIGTSLPPAGVASVSMCTAQSGTLTTKLTWGKEGRKVVVVSVSPVLPNSPT